MRKLKKSGERVWVCTYNTSILTFFAMNAKMFQTASCDAILSSL
jgi:hypothetical protein